MLDLFAIGVGLTHLTFYDSYFVFVSAQVIALPSTPGGEGRQGRLRTCPTNPH